MKKLTKGERFALAREARRLAMECVEGTAPEFGTGRLWYRNGKPCCFLGHLLARVGLHPTFADSFGLFADVILAANANDHYPDALPFAALSLADALEAAGASKTPSDLKAEVP